MTARCAAPELAGAQFCHTETVRKVLLLLLTASAAFAAEDAWAKVRELKSGVELRIYRKGQKQPVLARLDEARQDSLVVVMKNEQTAIDKEDIERIDCRKPQTGSWLKPEIQTTTHGPDRESPAPVLQKPSRTPQRTANRSRNTYGGLTLGSRPDLETIYRRPETTPQK